MLGLAAPLAAGQTIAQQPARPEDERWNRKLPDGRSMSEALIKEDFKRNMADLRKMRELIDEVEKDIEKSSGQVVSLDNLKRLEEVEKASRRIRGRMRRH
ncbi:MAG: hypothetical protein C0504_06425 [Candidatus Solibacter sp.]|nr:hypothetical protein [Candidatus Solibacter sp.]